MNDWNAAINELLSKGYSQIALSEKLGCSQPQVYYLASGKTDRVVYEIGERIVALCKLEGIQIKNKAQSEAN